MKLERISLHGELIQNSKTYILEYQSEQKEVWKDLVNNGRALFCNISNRPL
jgi:hypothetical protein